MRSYDVEQRWRAISELSLSGWEGDYVVQHICFRQETLLLMQQYTKIVDDVVDDCWKEWLWWYTVSPKNKVLLPLAYFWQW